MVYLQDGAEFFQPMRDYINVVMLEEGMRENTEHYLYWATCELMETIYNLCVENHGRGMEYEKVFYSVKRKWTEIEKVFHAVFRVPVASWLDTHIELRIVGRDLYLSPYKEP